MTMYHPRRGTRQQTSNKVPPLVQIFASLFLFLIFVPDRSLALTQWRNSLVRMPPGSTATTSTHLFMGRMRRRYRDDEEREHDDISRQRSTDRPTLTRTELIGPPIMPSKPKIVVLGASGRIGRLVVRQLLDMKHLDATIVACVRNYDKAIKVIYDDLTLAANNNPEKKGPRLQIVQADLVPPEELPGYLDEDETEWLERAESAAQFYGTKVKDYDNRQEAPVVIDSNESLEEAIKDCSTIISCVGAVRHTNIWTDFIVRPVWRLLRPNVSGWCKDGQHPYYVQFASTRKILGFAEREQLRREAAVEMKLEAEEEARDEPVVVPKIRFIRISDLCVAQPPWQFVPLLTNIMRSMVFRYHDMAERLLQSSTLIDSVILRPGDLIEDERDTTTTYLQVDSSGEVPQPAIVGREDVASLAVASVFFRSPREQESVKAWTAAQHDNNTDVSESQKTQHKPFHCTLAVRWVGNEMEPYPPQGSKEDGSPTADVALQNALRAIQKREKREKQFALRKLRTSTIASGENPESALRLVRNVPQRKLRPTKPYGITVAIPVYFVLAVLARATGRIIWNVLASRAWAQPIIIPLQQYATLAAAFVVTYLRIFQQFLSHRIPLVGIRKFFAAKKYITF